MFATDTKSSNQQSKLAEIDYQKHTDNMDKYQEVEYRAGDESARCNMYNPVEYTCGEQFRENGTSWVGSTYGCSSVFCQEDGCNQRAAGYEFGVWDFLQYCLVGLFLLMLSLPVCLCVYGLNLQARRAQDSTKNESNPAEYTPIPNNAP